MTATKSVVLANGVVMPIIGLGTYQITCGETIRSILDAGLAAGYRHIDTAAGYRNEQHIGAALAELLPKHGLRREDLFITSKVGPRQLGDALATHSAVASSLQKLATQYLDLLLIHWPARMGMPPGHPDHANFRKISWQTFEEVYAKGLTRAIGVSNFEVKHLEAMEGLKPMVNQVEYHPHYQQPELLKYCNNNGIHMQAYCSFGSSAHCASLLESPEVVSVAKEVEATAAQVLLRWATMRDVGVLPKSCNPQHIASNLQLGFSLTPHQMALLDAAETVRKYAWDPVQVL